MPIKSKAQRRKFAELLVEGKISPETFEEWNRAAGNAELPAPPLEGRCAAEAQDQSEGCSEVQGC